METIKKHRWVFGILAAAFALRTVLMLLCDGYSTDVTCFVAWSQNMVKYGASGFYTGGFFADYPPAYLYWLWGAGLINQVLGVEPFSAVSLYILGLLPLFCDMFTAWLAWYLCERAGHSRLGIFALALLAFSPALVFNLAVWKQVDSVIALSLLLCFLLLDRQRWYAAAALYALSVLIKPQAFIVGPVLAIGYLLPLFGWRSSKDRLRTLLTTAGSALSCLALIFVGSLPFMGTQSAFWLPQKYLATMSYYSYGSVNAFNLFSALGGNWQPADSGWLFTYSQWGIFFVLCSTVLVLWFGIASAKKSRTNLTLLAALYGILVFTFAHGMHERYSLLFLVLLLFGFLKSRDSGLLKCFIAQSAASFFNVAATLWCLTDSSVYGSSSWELCVHLGGALQVIVALCLVACCYRIFCGGGAVECLPRQNMSATLTPEPWAQALPWSRRDIAYLAVPTILCALISFWALGSRSVPETTWISSEADEVKVSFGSPTDISEVWVYASIADGYLEIWDDDRPFDPLLTAETPFGNMYRWQVFDEDFSAHSLTLRGYDASINEIVFVNSEGSTVPLEYVSPGGKALFDEQATRPLRPSSYTGMYFDEIYHARTAFEHLHGMEPYENSHPPLGKILIMLGIKLFGMNPFGWRFVGTLFGVLLLPLIYLLGRLLLGSREYALLGMLFFSLDFMRFTQSRIATIDTYAVFFILAAYYFMLVWLRQDTLTTALRRQLVPLALSGVCFGLACAVKWVGVYAGFGLALLFFLHLWEARREHRRVLELIGSGFAFFVAIPLVIYLVAYMPYYLCTAHPHTLSDVWGLQGFMLGYHGKLTATHPFESRWYSWAFIGRPIWYSMGTHLPEGMVSSIALLGNPAIWWSGAAAMLYTAYCAVARRGRRAESFLLIAFLSEFLPWIFISRSTFLYHYFPSLPFVILALCLTLRKLSLWKKQFHIVPFLLVALSLGLFVWFYPAMCDLPITAEYAKTMLWFKSWAFYILP